MNVDRVAEQAEDHPEVPQPQLVLIIIAIPIRKTTSPAGAKTFSPSERRLTRDRDDARRILRAAGADAEDHERHAAADPGHGQQDMDRLEE